MIFQVSLVIQLPIVIQKRFFKNYISKHKDKDLNFCFVVIFLVDSEEIKRLGKRFKKLDIDGSGSLSKEEFMQIHDLQQNPLVQRVIDLFDSDGNGEVDFKEFINGISQFSVRGDKQAKLKCNQTSLLTYVRLLTFCKNISISLFLLRSVAFKVYDMDRDGYISNGELFAVLKMMVGSNLKDTQLQQIVDKTIINADKDGDGKINYEGI